MKDEKGSIFRASGRPSSLSLAKDKGPFEGWNRKLILNMRGEEKLSHREIRGRKEGTDQNSDFSAEKFKRAHHTHCVCEVFPLLIFEPRRIALVYCTVV